MATYVIEGGRKLGGEVRIQGGKNSAGARIRMELRGP